MRVSHCAAVVFVAIAGCGSTPSLDSCDPFEDGCQSGDRCAMVFEFDAGDSVIDAGFFCVQSGGVPENGLCRGLSTGDDDAGGELVTDDCGPGLFCATLDSERRCRALCDGEVFGCGGLEFCRGLSADPFLAVCSEASTCDPIEQNCLGGDGCYAVAGGEGGLLTHCFEFNPPPGGSGQPGTPCEFIADCEPGTDCFPDPRGGSGSVCLSFCDPSDPSSCSEDERCTPLDAAFESASVFGVCE